MLLMEKRLLLMLISLFCLLGGGMSFAQNTASGVVVSSENDEPLVGATIRVVGTKTGTVTDADGKLSCLQAQQNSKFPL